ncbi:MAG: thiamine pyrophosphate-dependent enzyme [Candidatus Pacebacteria bacterium]|nr:thiamine pyrophosphate-dependent enzyme [Candidatus Paceibacterota bacterium]MDD4074009.1 thiamine pyrophosphate-dependent enzyme [Candidatus Paceibacterota bacterium]
MKLETNIINTWCPGCGNFGILQAIKLVINELGCPKENIVLVSDIGCNSKIVDYLNINSFYSLHGRSIATALGIKLANPELKVIVFIGDGAALDEGISHLIHAAKRNSNITVIMHNNRLFALTTGQFTAVSPKDMKGKSTPYGSIENPINPLELMLSSNATFISRGYSSKIDHLKKLIIDGVNHQGFSFIEVMQPCISFFNNIKFLNERCYEAKNEKLDSKEKAMSLIKEWNYDEKGKIPLGVFYKINKPNFEAEASKHITKDKKINNLKCLKIHS